MGMKSVQAVALGVLALGFSACGAGGVDGGGEVADGQVVADGSGGGDAVTASGAGGGPGTPDTLGGDDAAESDAGEPGAATDAPETRPCSGIDCGWCQTGSDCFTGFCVEHMGTGWCASTCDEGCPAGWSCEQAVAVSGADPVDICVSDFEHLGKPCVDADGCTSDTSTVACVVYDGEGACCGAECATDDDCPDHFACEERESTRGGTSAQCVHEAGVCW